MMAFAVAILILLPLHKSNTHNIPLPPLFSNGTFKINIPDGVNIEENMTLPLYRYFERSQTEIGSVKVIDKKDGYITCRILSDTLLYKLGRQGKIISYDKKNVIVDIPLTPKFNPKNKLCVFKDSKNIGQLEVISTEKNKLKCHIIYMNTADMNYEGLVVSEYIIQTNISVFSNNIFVVFLEIFIFLFITLMEIILSHYFQSSLIAYTGTKIIDTYKNLNNKSKKILKNSSIIIFSLPFCYFSALFTFHIISRLMGTSHVDLLMAQIFSGVLLIWYFYIFISRQKFPPLYLWESLSYRPGRIINRMTSNPFVSKSVIWFLHLFVAYAFAFALIGFLSGNINNIIDYVAPNNININLIYANLLKPESVLKWIVSTYMNIKLISTSGLAHLTLDQNVYIFHLVLWSMTIIGCLVGYIHSVVKILHFTSIKNIDFTILGWLTNAICYGPLMGWTLWSVIPGAYGWQPVIAGGPLYYIMLLLGLFFNIVYTASIWNMFTKFGVMVDKGLVDKGFFSIMRHPNYTLESFMFGCICLKGLADFSNLIGVSFYFITYWLRSEREEVFMAASNADYKEYKNRVKYKYIPGLI